MIIQKWKRNKTIMQWCVNSALIFFSHKLKTSFRLLLCLTEGNSLKEFWFLMFVFIYFKECFKSKIPFRILFIHINAGFFTGNYHSEENLFYGNFLREAMTILTNLYLKCVLKRFFRKKTLLICEDTLANLHFLLLNNPGPSRCFSRLSSFKP